MIAGLSALALAMAAPAPVTLDPTIWFRGRSHGTGTLKILFQAAKTVEVDSVGRVGKDGLLTLEQVIRQPGKAPRARIWRMRRDGPLHFSGTLSDAVGPVRVEAEAGALRIRYRDKDHLDIDQTLALESPRIVHNRMKVRRFGIIVATLDEIIRKLD